MFYCVRVVLMCMLVVFRSHCAFRRCSAAGQEAEEEGGEENEGYYTSTGHDAEDGRYTHTQNLFIVERVEKSRTVWRDRFKNKSMAVKLK